MYTIRVMNFKNRYDYRCETSKKDLFLETFIEQYYYIND